ncbi:hypothetical protein PTQ19_11765 [Microbacterium esteraromaticum]|uniref:hypothetical protein n=1 Tax=Microbacterium esteraromaticum TaxID=57043 RepID=UPI002367EB17|nr:hypothetical protein [Microbacterium esteraromaticum]WDH78189.1 hypothetical protein PTQ19_11765 [Microbacterium esteraromaticum]
MTQLVSAHQLSETLGYIGTVGAALAVVGALVACIAVAVGNIELGVPITVWLVGMLLAVAAAFVDLRPTVVVVTTGAALVVATVIRLAWERNRPRRMRADR